MHRLSTSKRAGKNTITAEYVKVIGPFRRFCGLLKWLIFIGIVLPQASRFDSKLAVSHVAVVHFSANGGFSP